MAFPPFFFFPLIRISSQIQVSPGPRGGTRRQGAGNRQQSQAKITESKLCWYSRSPRQRGTTTLKYHGLAPGKASNHVPAARIALPTSYKPGSRNQLSVASESGPGASSLRDSSGEGREESHRESMGSRSYIQKIGQQHRLKSLG